MPRKSNKQKKRMQKNNTSKAKSQRLRTSLDIYNRLIHDKALDLNLKNIFIGYNDNDNEKEIISEQNILKWLMIEKGGDIPMHHVVYFCVLLHNESKLMLWDRHTKLDRLYGSGDTNFQQKWINIKDNIRQKDGLLPVIKCIDSTIKFIKLYDEQKEESEEDDIKCKYPPLLVGKTTRNKSKFIHPKVSKKHKVIAVISAMVHKWGTLSPFHVRDDKGRSIENVWQFSKVYESIAAQNQVKFGKVKWIYPQVKKCINNDGTLTEEYWKWREVGMNHNKAVRFPVGRNNRFKCLYSVLDKDNPQKLSYIEARKKIYIPQYICALVKCEKYKQLKEMYDDGRYLLISEFDGPDYDDFNYYKAKYNRDDIVLKGNVMIPNKGNLKILLNDAKHPFGHGFCVAMALQGITIDDLL